MMTGILPTNDRFLRSGARADQDFPEALTLPEVFKENGYTTISLGKIFNSQSDSEEESWSEKAWYPELDRYNTKDPAMAGMVHPESKRGPFFARPDVPDNAYVDGMIGDRAVETLDRLKDGSNPFFLAVGFVRPHLPFYAPKKYWDLYDAEELELATNRYTPHNAPAILQGSGEIHAYHTAGIEYNSDEWHRTALHGYLACVSHVDAQIGRLLERLDELQLTDNTIIVLVGDHGWHLGEHNFWGKHNTLQNAIRVPLTIVDPRLPSQRPRTDALVGIIDIYPTLCDLAGLPAPADQLQGESVKPLLNGSAPADWRKSIYTRFLSGDCVVTNSFSYTRFVREGNKVGEMLFDLQNDAEENWNVVDDPNYNAIAREMSEELDLHIQRAQSKQPSL